MDYQGSYIASVEHNVGYSRSDKVYEDNVHEYQCIICKCFIAFNLRQRIVEKNDDCIHVLSLYISHTERTINPKAGTWKRDCPECKQKMQNLTDSIRSTGDYIV